MGASTTRSIGDFQAGVGRVSGDISEMMGYVFAGFVVLMAFTLVFLAFHHEPCDPKEQPDGQCNPNPGIKWPFLIGAVILVGIAALVVWFSRTYNTIVHSSRTASQVGGTLAEADMIRRFMQ